jgi:activator of 2-hydroxyglutaryl-CoA dehydratase
MGYFDFVMSEVHGLRIRELLDEKATGRRVLIPENPQFISALGAALSASELVNTLIE